MSFCINENTGVITLDGDIVSLSCVYFYTKHIYRYYILCHTIATYTSHLSSPSAGF